MSSKINIKDILTGHFSTLENATNHSTSYSDIFTFYIIPLTIALTGALLGFNLTKESVSLLVNFGSIFTPLLLSVLVLVYDQENKLETSKDDNHICNIKKSLLNQLYYNICYAIIVSLSLVLIAFMHQLSKAVSIPINVGQYVNFDISLSIHIITPLSIFIALNLILTIIMIVKRMHALLTTK